MAPVIVFLPLITAILVGLFGRKLGDRASQLITAGGMVICALLSIAVFREVAIEHHTGTIEIMRWIDTGPLAVDWAIRLDTLSAVMLCVVTIVSAVVHVYSIGYMSHDHSIPRFMAYLSFFTFAMLALVTADNFVQLFFGWEGVGTASYLLIGFWYDRPTANAAAIKAFVVNRVGDFGFALGIFAIFRLFGTLNFDPVFQAAPQMVGHTLHFLSWDVDALTCACILLFIGAMGKSAQLGLHTWLPDAMEGPTPVSALIHAATMVTAGVFMLCRLSPIFEYSQTALNLVVVIGGTTCFFAATVGMAQNDIKRVIAYSTCSQLGYMFFAAGVSAYPGAMFHLGTHAFFKALLFLGAGSVIHAVSGEQDMRKMGGLWKLIPFTYALMWIGNLALAGIWPFAGFYSKDFILDASYAAGTGVGMYAYWLGIVAAFLTSFYSWRLLFMTFHGAPRADHHVMEHVHESPRVMLWPLLILAAGAIGAGFFGDESFVGAGQAEFWNGAIKILPSHPALAGAEEIPWIFSHLALFVGFAGIALAWVAYIWMPSLPGQFVGTLRGLYLFVYNKWYFDELYDALFVRPAFLIGWGFWKGGDGMMIDGLGPDGIAAVTRGIARRASRLQTGYIYHYAFAMLIGVLAMVSFYIYTTFRH
ncbi:MAG TPA: NADH-quinone oxidoreductase subunit L [Aliidongia sp.]|nr:NADH-quinone oxidoreductase subunit L [Aliidongia sp.]